MKTEKSQHVKMSSSQPCIKYAPMVKYDDCHTVFFRPPAHFNKYFNCVPWYHVDAYHLYRNSVNRTKLRERKRNKWKGCNCNSGTVIECDCMIKFNPYCIYIFHIFDIFEASTFPSNEIFNTLLKYTAEHELRKRTSENSTKRKCSMQLLEHNNFFFIEFIFGYLKFDEIIMRSHKKQRDFVESIQACGRKSECDLISISHRF